MAQFSSHDWHFAIHSTWLSMMGEIGEGGNEMWWEFTTKGELTRPQL